MSTRSTIVSLRLNEDEHLHIFHDVDGIHITIETDPYEYKQDIHIPDDKWKDVLKQMKGEFDNHLLHLDSEWILVFTPEKSI